MRGCDVYVGLIGLRYGSPVRDQPDVSYTELELNVATEAVLPRLVFLLDEDAVLPEGLLEGNPDFRARQVAFRQRLRESGVTVGTVASPGQLELLLFQSLQESRLAMRNSARRRHSAAALSRWRPGQRGHSTGRRITAEDVRGFVGRSDELDRIARLLAPVRRAAARSSVPGRPPARDRGDEPGGAGRVPSGSRRVVRRRCRARQPSCGR